MQKHILSRRSFIKASAAAGTACSLIPGSVIGANERVNIAVIGLGKQGSNHMRRFGALENVQVVAASDPDKTRSEGKAPVVHQDLRRILDMRDVDAVVIATPNHWHTLAAIWACQAGKHVYVEKPVSHNIAEGRKMVEAARKYKRIVQAGTQQRSCPAVQECSKDVRDGMYGRVHWVHCSKLGSRKPIGKVTEPVEIPEHIDYNLWAGPAPMTPVMREKFHYDWHWQFNWGDGELGNWGVHYIDDLRHLMSWDDVPENVVSAGGRWWDDNGDTPNMIMSYMEHKGIKVVIDIRNMRLVLDNGKTRSATYKGSRGGNYIHCDNGFIRIARGGGKAYDHDGNMIKQYKGDGGSSHAQNFIDAIRADSNESLACEVEVGHQSTVMCHLANASYRVGKLMGKDKAIASMARSDDAEFTIKDILTQVAGHEIDFEKQPITVGPRLTYDNQNEIFTGDNAEEANKLIRRLSARGPFVHPEKI